MNSQPCPLYPSRIARDRTSLPLGTSPPTTGYDPGWSYASDIHLPSLTARWASIRADSLVFTGLFRTPDQTFSSANRAIARSSVFAPSISGTRHGMEHRPKMLGPAARLSGCWSLVEGAAVLMRPSERIERPMDRFRVHAERIGTTRFPSLSRLPNHHNPESTSRD